MNHSRENPTLANLFPPPHDAGAVANQEMACPNLRNTKAREQNQWDINLLGTWFLDLVSVACMVDFGFTLSSSSVRAMDARPDFVIVKASL